MQIVNNKIYLEDSKGYSSEGDSVTYVDLSGNNINIPINILIINSNTLWTSNL